MIRREETSKDNQSEPKAKPAVIQIEPRKLNLSFSLNSKAALLTYPRWVARHPKKPTNAEKMDDPLSPLPKTRESKR